MLRPTPFPCKYRTTQSHSQIHAHQVHLQDPHELSHERLQVENNLGSGLNAMLVKRRPLYHFTLQVVVDEWQQLECERLEDRCGWDTVCQQII